MEAERVEVYQYRQESLETEAYWLNLETIMRDPRRRPSRVPLRAFRNDALGQQVSFEACWVAAPLPIVDGRRLMGSLHGMLWGTLAVFQLQVRR